MSQRLCRTFQTAPAAVPGEEPAKYLRSGLTAEGFEAPDWLIPDLEDGTAPDRKAEGLELLVDLLPEHAPSFEGEIHPRIQWAYDSERARSQGRAEIDRLVDAVGDHLDGVVVPKVGRVADVERAIGTVEDTEREHGLESGSIDVTVIVETARARSDLADIASLGDDSRLAALVFGPVDYAAELGAREPGDGGPRWPGLLEALSNEASANGILSVGGPFDRLFDERAGVTYYNAPGYAEQVKREASLGFDGSWSLHPKQTIQANRIHMPTPEELRQDIDSIERFQEAKADGSGAVVLDGQMVDEATYRNFHNTVRTARTIHARQPEQVETRYDPELIDRMLALEIE